MCVLLRICQWSFQTMLQSIQIHLKVQTLWLRWTLGPAPSNQPCPFSNCIFWLLVLYSEAKPKSISTLANAMCLVLWVVPFSCFLAPFRIFIVCYFWTSCSLWQCVKTQSICQLPARWLNSNEWPLTYGLRLMLFCLMQKLLQNVTCCKPRIRLISRRRWNLNNNDGDDNVQVLWVLPMCQAQLQAL